jgi:hypothetical protein
VNDDSDNSEHELDADMLLVKVFHEYDDGRDWAAWHKWNMNTRRRISEKRFELPPARPQVSLPTIKPRPKPRARLKPRKQPETDF